MSCIMEPTVWLASLALVSGIMVFLVQSNVVENIRFKAFFNDGAFLLLLDQKCMQACRSCCNKLSVCSKLCMGGLIQSGSGSGQSVMSKGATSKQGSTARCFAQYEGRHFRYHSC